MFELTYLITRLNTLPKVIIIKRRYFYRYISNKPTLENLHRILLGPEVEKVGFPSPKLLISSIVSFEYLFLVKHFGTL